MSFPAAVARRRRRLAAAPALSRALVGAAFVVAAAVTWLRRPEWPRVLAVVSTVSLIVVTVVLWASVLGVVIDVTLLGLTWRAGGFTRAGGRR